MREKQNSDKIGRCTGISRTFQLAACGQTINVYTYIVHGPISLSLSRLPSSLPPLCNTAQDPVLSVSGDSHHLWGMGGGGERGCAGGGGEGAGDFENPMKRHGARGRVLRFRQTVVLGQKVVQTLRPGARATSKAAAASTQLTRLRAKERPGAGTGGVCELAAVQRELCRANSGWALQTSPCLLIHSSLAQTRPRGLSWPLLKGSR